MISRLDDLDLEEALERVLVKGLLYVDRPFFAPVIVTGELDSLIESIAKLDATIKRAKLKGAHVALVPDEAP